MSISVDVSYTQNVPGSGGGGATTTTQVSATVLPVCYYKPYMSGKDLAHKFRDVDDQTSFLYGNHYGALDEFFPAQKREEHAKDAEGYWYTMTCDQSRWNGEGRQGHFEFLAMQATAHGSNPPVWVEPGGQPPAPLIDGATLASAAWDAVEIPVPEIAYNPTLGSRDATLVGWYTWVWATGDTPVKVEATATAGPVSATVTAQADGLDLSAPDSQADCQGFGIPWQEGASGTDCTIVFTRSSAHLGGTTPLKTSIRYQVAYTASDGATGTLDSATTTSTHDVPVAEAQTLNTNPSRQWSAGCFSATLVGCLVLCCLVLCQHLGLDLVGRPVA